MSPTKYMPRTKPLFPRHDTASVDRPVPAGVNVAAFGSDVVAGRHSRSRHSLLSPSIPAPRYRGLHDSLVNYLGNEQPQMLLCLHEESAVAIAHGYAKVTGSAMAAAVHSNVGLMHATMAIFNAWCDRMPDAHSRRHRTDRLGEAAALDRMDPHRARPGRAGARLIPSGMTSRARRSPRASRCCAPPGSPTPQPCGPAYVNLDVELQEQKLAEPVAPIDAKRFMPDGQKRARRRRDQGRGRSSARCQEPGRFSPAAARAMSAPGRLALRFG